MRFCPGRENFFLEKWQKGKGKKEWQKSRSGCSNRCYLDPKCTSFYWWDDTNPHPKYGNNYCQLSSYCTLELSIETTSNDKGDLFIKGKLLVSI